MNYIIYKLKKLFKKDEFKNKIQKLKKELKLKKKNTLTYIFYYKNKKIKLIKSLDNDKYFGMLFNVDQTTLKKKLCFLKDKDSVFCEIPQISEILNYLLSRRYFDKNSFIIWKDNQIFCYLPIKVLEDINAIKMILNSFI